MTSILWLYLSGARLLTLQQYMYLRIDKLIVTKLTTTITKSYTRNLDRTYGCDLHVLTVEVPITYGYWFKYSLVTVCAGVFLPTSNPVTDPDQL